MNHKISVSLFALVMLITGAVDGISNLPSIALFGQQLVFFFISASLLFLLPTGLTAAELCTQFKEDSGIYIWSKAAYGSHFGALVIWLQWINTMVWFPTSLATLTGTAAYILDPALAHNPFYLVGASLSAFWLMTFLNLKHFEKSTKIAAIGTSIGMIFPMILIIFLCILWVICGKPMAIHLTKAAILPPLGHSQTWTSLTAVITAFLGMELAAVHVRKVKNAVQIFPKALVLSIILIVLTMGLGSLGIALVVPHESIVLVTGTVQAFQTLFTGFHIGWMEKVLGCMLVFGSLGTMVNWLISPANSLAQAAVDGYLPQKLLQKNVYGNPTIILIIQGIVVTFTSSAFFLMPSVNGSYWLLIDLSTELYVLMYFFMFLAAIKHYSLFEKVNLIPGKRVGATIVALLGLIGCCIALSVGFIPPSNIDVGSAFHYDVLFGSGLALMISPVLLLILYKHCTRHK